jgi:REP element-mobilizing transposase RayT
MPRPQRIDFAGAIHHIAALSVERERVFREPADRRRLLAQLEMIVDCYRWNLGSYCLMGTHFHLVVHTPEPTLSRGVQHLCGSYAQWFNWKYRRRGHVFGRRFGSVHIVTDEHLLEAHRYVALNPVRAGLCRRPESWPWGSFRALAGLEAPLPFLETDSVLSLFANRRDLAQPAFRRFVEAGRVDDAKFPLVRVEGV